jgi:carboxyl-terminal processing protease
MELDKEGRETTAVPNNNRFGSKIFKTYLNNHRLQKRLIITITTIVVIYSIFLIGFNFGNGRFHIGNNSGVAGLPQQLNYSSVNQVYDALKANYNGKLTEDQVLNGIKHGLAQSANDPYTVYFTPAEAKAFNNQLNSTFSGIGAELSQNSNGELQVIAPISGAPADKSGIKEQDLITSINGKSTVGISVDAAVNEIRGPAGSKVTLGILRGSNAFNITITRQNITVPSVNYKILTGNIGYIQISTFGDDTSSLMQQDATKLLNAHVKGIVLDLRDNPGGLLTAAVNVSSLWLPPGQLILQEKTGNTVVQTYQALGGDSLNGIPTVILINGGSASASEITTGALHDNKDAYVIGTKSFGKGVVQQLINFPDGSQLKVTVADWYRPDGQDIEHKGITPDETVNLTDQQISAGNDTQLNAAISYLNSH